MIKTVEYEQRVYKVNDLNNITLPNAFKLYVQCRTPVDNTNSDIYNFTSRNSMTYISGKTLLELCIYDYASLVANGYNIVDQINDTLCNAGVQMKCCFVQRL